MKTLTGPIERVGSSSIIPLLGMRRYSMVKIGGQVLHSMTIYEALDAFVEPSPKPVTIYYVGNGLISRWAVGVVDADGDYYKSRMSIFGLILLWFAAILLCAVFVGFGILPMAAVHTILAVQTWRLPAPPAGKRWVTLRG